MRVPAAGSCQCGALTLQLSSEPLFTYACHCMDCQKRTGSAFSMGLVCAAGTVDIEGELVAWQRTSDDGHTNIRYSCAGCGNIIYGDSSAAPELWKVQAGLLEDTHNVQPEVHIWTCRKQGWVTLAEDVPRYQRQPEDLAQLFTDAIAYRTGQSG